MVPTSAYGTAYSYTQPGLLVCWEKVKGIFEGQ